MSVDNWDHQYGPSYRVTTSCLVSSGWHSIQLGLHDLFHLANPDQIRHRIAFFFPVKNLLTIEIHFEAAIGAGGEREGSVTTKRTEKLVRHPRGGRGMFSSHAVDDVYQHFPFCCHDRSPVTSDRLHECGTNDLLPRTFYCTLPLAEVNYRSLRRRGLSWSCPFRCRCPLPAHLPFVQRRRDKLSIRRSRAYWCGL